MPEALRRAIDAELTGANRALAVENAPALSHRYREGRKPAQGRPVGPSNGHTAPRLLAETRADALAYVLSRMPATYGAVYAALRESLRLLREPERIRTLLDVGAGTGAAAWAADALLTLEAITCAELAPVMRQAGQSLAQYGSGALRMARWLSADVTARNFNEQADVVISAYLMNELDVEKQKETALRLFHNAGALFLLVEPGTPAHARRLLNLRTCLVDAGAFVLAPCPHTELCPLPETDWCHFTVRVPRSRAHKQAKHGDAPYEDEKYTYLAVSKTPPTTSGARVLRHPERRKGHTVLSLCTDAGLRTETVTRADGFAYAWARKAQSGDFVAIQAPHQGDSI